MATQTPTMTIEQHLAQLAPRAAQSYLAGYARAGLPVPLGEYQLAIVRARASLAGRDTASRRASAPVRTQLHSA